MLARRFHEVTLIWEIGRRKVGVGRLLLLLLRMVLLLVLLLLVVLEDLRRVGVVGRHLLRVLVGRLLVVRVRLVSLVWRMHGHGRLGGERRATAGDGLRLLQPNR